MTSVTGLIGVVFDGRYKIVELIGKGGMGAVYKAMHIAMSHIVALKVLNPEALGDDTAVQRFYHEAKASSRLQHPNTIKVFDFGRSAEGHLYLAMEYLSGQTLGELLRNEKVLPVGRTIKIIKQILKSLGEAHDQGLVHRDLKPDNIFLTDVFGEADFVKVLDFGISKFVDSSPDHETLTQAGLIPGTPLYVSPEQALGRPVDGRSDIYALGIIMYQMVTGRPPFRADSAVALVMKQIHDQPPDPTTFNPNLVIPDRLKALIFRMLDKDAKKRPANTLDIYHELESIEKECDFPEIPSKDLIDSDNVKTDIKNVIHDSKEITSTAQTDHDSPTTYITEQDDNLAAMKTQFIPESDSDKTDDLPEQPTAYIKTPEDDESDAALEDLARDTHKNKAKPWVFLFVLVIAVALGIGLYQMLSGSDKVNAEINKPAKAHKTIIKTNKTRNMKEKQAKKIIATTHRTPVKAKKQVAIINRKPDTKTKPSKPRKIEIKKSQQIEVITIPPKAVVKINGKSTGKAPITYIIPTKAKKLSVNVSIKNYKEETKTITIDKFGRLSSPRLVFRLKPVAKHGKKKVRIDKKHIKKKKHSITSKKVKSKTRKRHKRHHRIKLDWNNN